MKSKFRNVLITGGAGYVGSLLTPQLLNAGYHVTVYDTCFFGDHFLPKDHPSLVIVKGDIRDSAYFEKTCKNRDAIIHLACISNDASFELDPSLSTSINLDAFEPLVIAAKRAGIKRFINASTSSVYGISDAPNITEDHPLVPLTFYNKYKGICESLLFKHQDDHFVCVTIRPATVCGYAPRLRLDLSVNILTNQAISNGKIKVFGGAQLRPNIHIQDICDLYEFLLEVPNEKIRGETFNAGYQNYSIRQIAEIVKKIVENEFPEKGEIKIETTSTDDPRSYHINSDKIKSKIGFEAKYGLEDAIRGLCQAFREKKVPNSMENEWYY